MDKKTLEKYAEILVDYSTEVKEGDLVVIRLESYVAQPLAKEIYKRVLQKGGNPVVRCAVEELTETFIKYASDAQLSYIDPMSEVEYDKVDKVISIGAPLNVKNMARSNSDKMAKRSKATRELSQTLLKRAAEGELSWVIADYPTNALAQEAKMSIEEYGDFIVNACYLELDNPIEKWREIGKKQDILVDYLNTAGGTAPEGAEGGGTKTIRFVGEKTDVTFSTEGRKWLNCCGLNNFPDGEIYTSPVEDSANGQIYFDFPAIYRGNEAHKILIKLENGKVVDAKAEKGQEFLLSMLNMDEGSSFVGEIAIGTNERIVDVTGNILFDEKIGGSIHVAFGSSYPETGGKNVSGLHWDIIKNMKNGGQIFADDKLIYENGEFLI